MGINQDWILDVENSLKEMGLSPVMMAHPFLDLLSLGHEKFILNLISLSHGLKPNDVLDAHTSLLTENQQMIQLWEDIWLDNKLQVLNRISSLLGRNERIHGRKTTLVTLTQQQANTFFRSYHIQGIAKAKYNYGLIYNGELVAAAGFSGLRPMKSRGPNYQSAELIRFATISGKTITGGLTKLIKHFCGLLKPNDLMSYADKDWSLGKGYQSVGFVLDSISEPSEIWLERKSNRRYFTHRLPENFDTEDYIKVFNTGNLKYLLYL